MPMLALMLLLSSLLGAGDGPAGDALREQIHLAETQQPAAAGHWRDTAPVMLYPLRQDRVLRLDWQPLPQGHASSSHTPAATARVAQIWERVDGHWKLQRMVSLDDLIVPR
ncbi:hypothetical protein E5C33_07080 [Stenotrophomonas maltophilia]|uniref:hypothetical protein n=1 Tax=Stenotrophomonas maltophilia TaxID=40324 RepID=UPI0010767FA7|nr:hypothetical protein [Stenotrophomonas maltophilia]TFZ46038.1 hypothetical protein E5C33_07080 [Stenotrophomonas maltophilia]